MAERLERYEHFTKGGKYPWDTWLDGSVWRLVKGEDYTASATAVRNAARERAMRMGGRLRSRVELGSSGREALVIQYVARTLTMEPDRG